MAGMVLISLLVLGEELGSKNVTFAEKQAFLKLLRSLPSEGEFYSSDGVKKAVPYIRVLVALTKNDIPENDIYPFLALSRGLCDNKVARDYTIANFRNIKHPRIKLFWGQILFYYKSVNSPEIVVYLQRALQSPDRSKDLSWGMGEKTFMDFKRRLRIISKKVPDCRKK